MQPIRITINGEFWDSFIYKGKLFLILFNKQINVYEWDQICDFIGTRFKNLYNQGIYYGLKYGNELYNDINNLNPQEIEKIRQDFVALGQKKIELDLDEIARFLVFESSLPFTERPNDIEIFRDRLFAATSKGVEWSQLSFDSFEIGRNGQTISDVPSLHLRATYGGRIAVSAGDDGLFEYSFSEMNYSGLRGERNLRRVSTKHSSFADWNYSSLYNSSDEGESFLVVFQKISKKELSAFAKLHDVEVTDLNKEQSLIHLKFEVSQHEIFASDKQQLSWGGGNKIYCWSGSNLLITDFQQYNVKEKSKAPTLFSKSKILTFSKIQEEIVSAGVSFFGIIIELENQLLIIDSSNTQSTDSFIEVLGSVGKWRTYPRSVRYNNQLHVIGENHMEIFAFTTDFFINQSSKSLGMKWQAPEPPVPEKDV